MMRTGINFISLLPQRKKPASYLPALPGLQPTSENGSPDPSGGHATFRTAPERLSQNSASGPEGRKIVTPVQIKC